MSTTHPKVGLGILAGVSTGFFWGLPFLVPQALQGFSSLEISFGRFFFFGIASLFFARKAFSLMKRLSNRDRFYLLCLSAAGFWFYSTLLFWGIQQTDGIISSLIVGLLPISISIFSFRSDFKKKKSGLFYLGLLSIMIGLMTLFSYPVIIGIVRIKTPSVPGVLVLVLCLCLWTWYAVQNSKFLRSHPNISGKDLVSIIGIISLISISPFFLSQVEISNLVNRPDFHLYLFCSIALGFGSSWLANWLWNICSIHCSTEIAGPLMISETVFGLLYSFIFEKRLPMIYEGVAIAFCLMGAFIAVRASLTLQGSDRSSS